MKDGMICVSHLTALDAPPELFITAAANAGFTGVGLRVLPPRHAPLQYPVAVDPLRAEMFQPLLKPDEDGFITVPDRPGIGFELNMELLNRYRVG